MARVIWSPRSLENIESIIEFISKDSERRAKKWAESIFEATDNLKDFPSIGRIIPELNRSEIRELIKGNYRIVYEVITKNIEILAVRNFAENRIL